MRHRRSLLLVSALSTVATAQTAARITYITPSPQLALGERDPAPAALIRVVHAVSGKPVSGAELFAIGEEAHPTPGDFRALGRAVADADGIVHAPHRETWLMARATGLGPTMQLRLDDRVMLLAPSVDVPIRPVDWLGRPLTGAMFGFCGGCGHTPDLATAYVGADGIAWLRDVDPRGSAADIYPNTAPVELSYWSTQWVPGDAPEEFAYSRGSELHGTVLQADGMPAKFVPVGCFGLHRGPWTKTNGKGRFRLFGLSAGEAFFVVHAGRRIECPWPETTPCELRLPPVNGDQVQTLLPSRPDDPSELQVRIEFVDPDGAAVDAKSWWTKNGKRQFVQSKVPEWLAPGSYQVRIEHPDYAVVEQMQTVLAEEGQTLRFVLPRLPTVRIETSGLDKHCSLVVVRPESQLGFEHPFAAIDVPVRGGDTFAVQLRHTDTDQSRWFQFDADQALAAGTVRVAWYAPTKVLAQLADEYAAPVAADVRLLPRALVLDRNGVFDPRDVDDLTPASNGRVALSSEQDRLCFLWIRPHLRTLQPRLVAVPMPARADEARVDLGRIVLRAEPQLILRPAGKEEAATQAQLLRAGYGCFELGLLPSFPIDEQGRWFGPDLVVGDGVLVPTTSPGTLPLRHVVQSSAPVVATTPIGTLELQVRNAKGEAVAATILVRECTFACDGNIELRHLPTGACTIFVLAEGYATARIEAQVVIANDQQEIEVVMPRL